MLKRIAEFFRKLATPIADTRMQDYIAKNSPSEPRAKNLVSFKYNGEYRIPTLTVAFDVVRSVKSESNPKMQYDVNLSHLTCTCKSYEHLKGTYPDRHPGNLCKHLINSLIENAKSIGLKPCEVSCLQLTKDRKGQERYLMLSDHTGDFIAAFTKGRSWVNICKDDYWGYSPDENRWAGDGKPKQAGYYQAVARYISTINAVPASFSLEPEIEQASTQELVKIAEAKRPVWIRTYEASNGNAKIHFTIGESLTLSNCPSTGISEMVEQTRYTKDDSTIGLVLSSFLFKYNVRVKEIEDYYDRYRLKYQERLKEVKEPLEAAKFLNIRPFRCCNREIQILSGYDKQHLIEVFTFHNIVRVDKIKLVELFGGNEQFKFNFSFYMARGANTIHKSTGTDYYRARFETLVRTGMAIQGKALKIEDLLTSLAMKDIRTILNGTGLKCGKKEEGIAHILSLSNYESLVAPYLSDVGDYFKLLPLPFVVSENFRKEVEEELKYYSSVASVVVNLTSTAFIL